MACTRLSPYLRARHSDSASHRDLGVVETIITVFIPAYYVSTYPFKAAAMRELDRLSQRVERLTSQIPGIETVRGIFSDAGSKTGPQFRSAMHVLDVSLSDQPAMVREVVNALTAWYLHVKSHVTSPEHVATLNQLRDILWSKLRAFATFGCHLATPKGHGCCNLAGAFMLYGPYDYVSTDSYERSHKALKAVYERCDKCFRVWHSWYNLLILLLRSLFFVFAANFVSS